MPIYYQLVEGSLQRSTHHWLGIPSMRYLGVLPTKFSSARIPLSPAVENKSGRQSCNTFPSAIFSSLSFAPRRHGRLNAGRSCGDVSGNFSRSMGSQHDTSVPEIKRSFKEELLDTMQNNLAQFPPQQPTLPHTSSHLHTGTYLTNFTTIAYQPENIFQPYTKNQHGGSTNSSEGIRKGCRDQVDLDVGKFP